MFWGKRLGDAPGRACASGIPTPKESQTQHLPPGKRAWPARPLRWPQRAPMSSLVGRDPAPGRCGGAQVRERMVVLDCLSPSRCSSVPIHGSTLRTEHFGDNLVEEAMATQECCAAAGKSRQPSRHRSGPLSKTQGQNNSNREAGCSPGAPIA